MLCRESPRRALHGERETGNAQWELPTARQSKGKPQLPSRSTVPWPIRCVESSGRQTFRRLTMGIIAWIVLGLIAGAIAKAIMPGRDPGGIVVTMLIGIVGAFLGGVLWDIITNPRVSGFS